MSDRDLDETDRRIIRCLEGDARNVTTAEIGETLGISGSTVANRISRLEDAGIIAGYAPIVDYDRSGYGQHHLLVGTIVGDDRDAVLQDVASVTGVVDVTALVADRENVYVEAVAEEQAAVEAIAAAVSDSGVDLLRTGIVTNAVGKSANGFGEWRADGDSSTP